MGESRFYRGVADGASRLAWLWPARGRPWSARPYCSARSKSEWSCTVTAICYFLRGWPLRCGLAAACACGKSFRCAGNGRGVGRITTQKKDRPRDRRDCRIVDRPAGGVIVLPARAARDRTAPGDSAAEWFRTAAASVGKTGLVEHHPTGLGRSVSRRIPHVCRDPAQRTGSVPAALDVPWQVPFYVQGSIVEEVRPSKMRPAARAFQAQSRVDAADGRMNAALDGGLACVRLGAKLANGGLLVDALTGWTIASTGHARLLTLSPRLDAEQCRRAAQELEQCDRECEPLSSIMARDGAWDQESRGWLSRLVATTRKLTRPRDAEELFANCDLA